MSGDTSPRCAGCGVAYSEHLGLTGTCAARRAAEEEATRWKRYEAEVRLRAIGAEAREIAAETACKAAESRATREARLSDSHLSALESLRRGHERECYLRLNEAGRATRASHRYRMDLPPPSGCDCGAESANAVIDEALVQHAAARRGAP